MRIAIIGAGKFGSWLRGQFQQLRHEVKVYDSDPSKLKDAAAFKSIDELGVFKAELLINAVSLQNTVSVFRDILPHCAPETVLADVASVKTGLPEFYGGCGHRFVSVHPMFGPTFANMDSLRRENAIMIRESDVEARTIFSELFTGLGLNVFEFSFAEHDQMMAYSLTTPFVASLVFAACVKETSVPGTTFGRHKAIAEGLLQEDPHLVAEILFNPHSLRTLETITAKLEFLKHVIKARDANEIEKLMARLRLNVGLKEP